MKDETSFDDQDNQLEHEPIAEPANTEALSSNSNESIATPGDEIAVETEPATIPDQFAAGVAPEPLATVNSTADTASEATTVIPAPVVDEQQTSPVIDSAEPLAVPPSSGKKKKVVVGSIIAAALVILGGGGAAAYTMWYQNPDKVLSDALVNMIHAESVTYTGTIDLTNHETGGTSSTAALKSMKLIVEGKNNNSVGEHVAKLSIDYDNATYDITGAALIDKDSNLYVKVGGVKKILTNLAATGGGTYSQLPQYIQDIVEKLDDKWVRISSDDLKELDEGYDKTKTCTDEVFKKLNDDKAMTDELVMIYQDNKFIVVKESLPTKDGSLGYVIEGDKAKLEQFAKAANKSKFAVELQKCDDTFTLNEDDDDATEVESAYKDTRIEVWVDRWSHQLTKLHVTGKTDEASAVATVEPIFNKHVEVTAPTDYVKLSELKTIYDNAMKQYQQDVYNTTMPVSASVLGARTSLEL